MPRHGCTCTLCCRGNTLAAPKSAKVCARRSSVCAACLQAWVGRATATATATAGAGATAAAAVAWQARCCAASCLAYASAAASPTTPKSASFSSAASTRRSRPRAASGTAPRRARSCRWFGVGAIRAAAVVVVVVVVVRLSAGGRRRGKQRNSLEETSRSCLSKSHFYLSRRSNRWGWAEASRGGGAWRRGGFSIRDRLHFRHATTTCICAWAAGGGGGGGGGGR